MSLLDYIIERRGIPESDIRSVTQMVTHMAYEVRLWNHRRIRVCDYEWRAA